jgi:hypothetical protein
VDLQRLVQRSVERSAVAVQLLPQLLLLMGVGEEGGWRIDVLLPLPRAHRWIARAGGAGVGRRGLGAMPRAPGHHVSIPLSDELPRLTLGGWCG